MTSHASNSSVTSSTDVVAVVDYGLANIQSVVNALECFTPNVRIATIGEDLFGAAKIVLPGVGHFDVGMRGLRSRGHCEALNLLVLQGRVPLLGICLGLQFLFEGSEEGSESGLGWFGGGIAKLKAESGVKVPHMGWSEVESLHSSRLLTGIVSPIEFYFVHSYYAPIAGDAAAHATAICPYGPGFVAALERENIFATQFHPEKSQLAGMKVIETFLAL